MHEVLQSRLSEVRELSRRHGVATLSAFGSVLTPAFDPKRSDIDLLVSFIDPDLGPWMRRFFEFQRDLESLLGIKVDLVLESGLVNPVIRQAVERERSPLYGAA